MKESTSDFYIDIDKFPAHIFHKKYLVMERPSTEQIHLMTTEGQSMVTLPQ